MFLRDTVRQVMLPCIQVSVHSVHLEKLRIKCIRIDNQISSGQLLDKSKKYTKSRLVIIKIDSNNLNVYFELGVAMGLNKDVLLSSEKD